MDDHKPFSKKNIGIDLLQDNQFFLNELISSTNALVFEKDVNGAYTMVNQRWEEVTGIPMQSAIGKTSAELFPSDLAIKIKEREAGVFEPGNPTHATLFVQKGYNRQEFFTYTFPRKDANGKIEALVGIGIEITSGKISEERLRRLTRCMLAFGTNHDANINSLVALAGEEFGAACALYNRLEDNILCSLGQWNTPPGYNPVDKPEGHICYDLIKSGKSDVLIINNLHLTDYFISDPNVAPYGLMSYVGVPVKFQNDAVGSLCIVYQFNFIPTQADIDFFQLIGLAVSIEEEQKADEQQVKESERRLQKLLMEVPSVAVQGIDINGIVLYWNKASERFYGFTAEEATGKHIWDIIIPENIKNEVRDEIAWMFAQQRPIPENEMHLMRKDGSEIVVLTSHALVQIDDKETILYSMDQDITGRKQIENKLKENETTYRNLFQNAQVGLFRNRLDGSILHCNDQLARMSGYTSTTEFINEYVTSQNYVDVDARDRMWSEIMTNGYVENFEARFYRKDRSIFWVSFSARIYPEQGWLEGVAIDITTQKEAQKAISAKEANLKAIIENSLDSVWSVDLDYRIQYVNEVFATAFYTTFGNKLSPGINILESLPETLRPLWKARYDRAFNNEHYSFVDEINLGTQSIFIEVSMQPILIDGLVSGASFYGRDISEKTNSERLLKYQAELRKLLVDFSTDFINLPLDKIDDSIQKALATVGAFVGADRSYIFEYDYEKEVGIYAKEWCRHGIASFIDVFKYLPFEGFESFLSQHKRGESVQISDIEALENNDLYEMLKAQDIRSLLTIPLIKQDECIGFVGFDSVRAVKHFDEYELQLLNVFAQMIVNIYERLENEASILQAKEKAEYADKLKTAFLQNMSHEIRTPLNGILGFVDLLKDISLSADDRAKFLGIVEKSGKRLLNTINDILEISKIEAGQEKIHLCAVNTEEVLHYFLEFFKPQAYEKNIHLILEEHVKNENAIIQTDKHKFETILSNLINNALKFTHKGNIKIGSYREFGKLIFYVSDTGSGIPKERQQAIFDRFVQADLKITRPHEGSGLGLSIVKAYIDMLGGEIWLDSEPEKGSVFTFALPHQSVANALDPEKQESIKSDFKKESLILIAEDDEVSQMLTEKILHKEGFRTVLASNGNQAIEQLVLKPDLILLDLKMPGLSGFDTANAIRITHPDIPIVALTAYALAGDREKALSAGCNAYITKPLSKALLLKTLKQFLS